jgi:hypothetical protein
MSKFLNSRNFLWSILSISVFAAASIILSHQKSFLNFVQAVTIDDTPVTRKVLVLDFDPVLQTQGNQKLTKYKGWSDPTILTPQLLNVFPTVSNGYLTMAQTEFQQIDQFFPLADGYTYTEDAYFNCLANTSTCHTPQGVDYAKLFTDYGICSKNVDEVWLWGGPYFGYDEFKPVSYCGKTMFVMGFSYERQFDEALHDFGHRMEFIGINRVGNGTWAQDESNEWNKYSLIAGHCGNVHFPPGSSIPSEEYIYNKTTLVSSDCNGYLNYPTGPFVPTSLTCDAWGCTQRGYVQWWLSHIPHLTGQTTVGGKTLYNNWWKYYANYDETVTVNPTQSPGTFTNLSSSLLANKSIFNFNYSGTTSTYRIDLSISSDMVNGTYLTFGQGTSSPISVTDPTKWTSYVCGAQFWWRVRTEENVTSPIQTATVDCSAPSPTSTPTQIPTPTSTLTPTPVPNFTNLSASLLGTKATYNFTPVKPSSMYYIDMSNLADMSWNVYLSFGQGTSSPIIVTDPTKWTGVYKCGATLYWRVRTAENAYSGIQTGIIDCSIPTPTNTPIPPTPTRTPTPVPVTNKLINPSFEADTNNDSKPDSWTTDNGFTRSSILVHTGGYAGRFFSNTNASYSILQNIKGIIPGRGYSFSGWVNIPTTTDNFTLALQAVWKKSNGGTISTSTVKTYSSSTGGWNNAAGSFVAPANAASVDFVLSVQSLKATIYVDDFQVL